MVLRPLQTLHNVCEDIKWEAWQGQCFSVLLLVRDSLEGIDFRLRKYEEFFREFGSWCPPVLPELHCRRMLSQDVMGWSND